jgi:hypothetical protein
MLSRYISAVEQFSTMTNILRCVSVIGTIMSFCPGIAQAPLPVSDLRLIASIAERDFGSIDSIRTIGMTDDPDGRFDLIIIGSKPRAGGWRVEVLSATHHKVTPLWDSTVAAKEPQYLNSGSKGVTVKVRDYDYDLLIEGCAPHLCHDGVSGFLMFSGRSGKTLKAEVVARDLNKPSLGGPRYEVTFSNNTDDESKAALEKSICQSRTISDAAGLPFSCQPR